MQRARRAAELAKKRSSVRPERSRRSSLRPDRTRIGSEWLPSQVESASGSASISRYETDAIGDSPAGSAPGNRAPEVRSMKNGSEGSPMASSTPTVCQRMRARRHASSVTPPGVSSQAFAPSRRGQRVAPTSPEPSSFDRDEPVVLGKRASCVGEICHRDQHVIALDCRRHLRLPRPPRRRRRSIQSRQDCAAGAPAPTASSDAWKSVLSILP